MLRLHLCDVIIIMPATEGDTKPLFACMIKTKGRAINNTSGEEEMAFCTCGGKEKKVGADVIARIRMREWSRREMWR